MVERHTRQVSLPEVDSRFQSLNQEVACALPLAPDMTFLAVVFLDAVLPLSWASAGFVIHIRDPSSEQIIAAVHFAELNASVFAETL